VARSARRGISALVVIIVLIGGAVVGVRLLWQAAQKAVRPNGCTFAGSTQLDLGQSSVASTMVSVVLKRGLPERAAVLVIGAGLQESKLRNLASGEGDRDSVGVLQQRPSQGWGTEAQLSDIRYATGKFLDALVKIPNWKTMDFAEAIQAVQISAETAAYARHATNAQNIADALWGTTAAGVTCRLDAPTVAAQASLVAQRAADELPISTPSVNGRILTISGARWATAGWLLCHADQYGIAAVRYDGQEWTRTKGWHERSDAPNSQVQAEMAVVK